jgi:choline dehydrogenase-like flavoprotein
VRTSKIGAHPPAVVDERLRVGDASNMPTLVSGNRNAPAGTIAEKASAMILQDAR